MNEKVNKITARFVGNMVFITLYRTNHKLAKITNEDLKLDPFDKEIHRNKTNYLNYCKDVVHNLLKNDGIPGYYFDDIREGDKLSKLTHLEFVTHADKAIRETIINILADSIADIEINSDHSVVDIKEVYPDHTIKYGQIIVDTLITIGEGQTTNIGIIIEIRSGQVCKPKTMLSNQESLSLNRTNLKRLLKNK